MSDEPNDGGYAFPVAHAPYAPNNRGMSLRDWYAGQALAGLCANPGGPFQANGSNGWDIVNCDADHIARWCQELADAMLAARKPRP